MATRPKARAAIATEIHGLEGVDLDRCLTVSLVHRGYERRANVPTCYATPGL
ncbi:MAG: hypothetical protein ACP5H2_05700 [Solirubrobacteraceae bacterium]